jgi:DNA-binding PadR family transcriptional regulator
MTTIPETILALFRSRPRSELSGHEISDVLRLSSGVLYPALMSLERHGDLTSRWEDGAWPRRRLYRLTQRKEPTP